ncbi:hypothetical protein DGWBC_1007 [Dehalogenimonas sp. WBC-2]|nr:hypothetical protein DGWBC_1007 [Dehalogenimonas sp. WBC-2]
MKPTAEQNIMLEAINAAILLETEGKKCYLAASKNSKNDAGKTLLLSLAEEEEDHKKRFTELYDTIAKGHGWTAVKPSSRSINHIKNTMANTCQALGIAVVVTDGEFEALRSAIQKEKESYMFYKEHANKAVYPTEKEFYTTIANEEWEHELALLDYQEYLTDPAGWFVEQEHPSLDGG